MLSFINVSKLWIKWEIYLEGFILFQISHQVGTLSAAEQNREELLSLQCKIFIEQHSHQNETWFLTPTQNKRWHKGRVRLDSEDHEEDSVCASFLVPVCVCITQLPFREHLFNALLLRWKGDVCTLAAEQLVLRSVHTHHRWRLEFIREVLRNTSVNGLHK